MTVADFTAPELLLPRLHSGDMRGAVEELALVLHAGLRIADAGRFTEQVLQREATASTAWESGLALPHARLSGLDQPWFALGHSRDPIPWGRPKPTPISFVLLMAVPEDSVATYLALLSGISRMAAKSGLLHHLRITNSPGEMWAALQRVELPLPVGAAKK